ncbi:hypothetical protein [Saccharicrinis aurantiacus]|uniref:hypothetical protein n=1 Tax=Saccharicrinis aurantiacus TaxID=1849719 RepID=UPI00248F9AC9|nr:hypothetical protein [Saccharicrinis aurantiacus]
MIKYILIFLTVGLVFSSSLEAKNIPDSLVHYINKELPKYKIPSCLDYMKGWESFQDDDTQLPFFCTSDYNGDNLLDFAVLLKDSSDELFLYVFLQQANGYEIVLIDKIQNYNSKKFQIVIRSELKGVWESITEKITVCNNGISIVLIEESLTWSYYYHEGKFIQFIYD